MREIRFKCWIPSEKFMGVPFDPFDDDGSDGRWPSDAVFLQWTGLLDKNGKEIYEGDIIKWAFVNTGDSTYDDLFYTEAVEWSECGFFLDGGAPLTVAMDDCEVIGNQFENPELLTP